MEQLQIVAKITPGAIQTNFEETKQWLAKKLQKYNLSNYTGDDAIKQMKEGRATLNKLSDALKERKRVVKEQFLEPYTAFEMAADELLAMIQESCDTLDGKIKEYVLIEKQEREAEITKYYQEAVAEAGITYDLWTQIYDEKWLNKSCSKKNWKMAITEAIQSYQKNIMLLGQLAGEDDFEAARKLYEVDLNLQDAITYITKKKAEAEALERERIRIAAEEAAKAQARVEAETRQVMQQAESYAREREAAVRKEEQEAAQKQMQQKQQELEQQTYLRMQKQMQRQTQTMPVQRAGMSYQTGIPTGESTMSGGRAAATSGQGMPRPAYGIRQGMQRQQPVQRGNAPIQRSVQQPILQTQAAELCTFTVHRVHQEEVCQFLTQRGIGYHIH